MTSLEQATRTDIDERIIPNPWIRWLLIIAAYTGLAIFFFGQSTVSSMTSGRELNLAFRFWNEILYWYLWAVATPLILLFARRFRIEKDNRWRGIAAHVFLAIILSPLHDMLWRFLTAWWQRGLTAGESIEYIASVGDRILVGSFTGFYKYWLIVALYYVFDYYHKYRRREREADALAVRSAQLQAQLTQAELDALKMQLHPHFLFNTLNTISVLMTEDTERANRMLLRLGDLLRLTLDQARAETVPLSQEIAFIRSYLYIEQERFADRLKVEYQVTADVLDAAVPSLILQPLVENAIRHGLAPKPDTGTLRLSANRDEDQLMLVVEDDGVGISSKVDKEDGIGIANTRARLDRRYGDRHQFTMSSNDSGGVTVVIRLPFAHHTGEESH